MTKSQQGRAATFRSAAELFHADNCTPLEAAARRGEVRLAAWGRGSYPGRRLPAEELREVCSAGFWDASRRQSWGLDWHRNEGIEFTFLAAGKLPFAVDRRSTTLSAGELTVTRPWQKHRVGNPQVPASRLIWLILDVGVRRPNQAWRWSPWLLLPPARLQRLTHQLRHNERISWPANREVTRCFAAIAEVVELKINGGNLTRLKLLINELLLALSDLLDQKSPRLDKTLVSSARAVQLFLDELPQRCDEPWTLETMARQCGLGRSYFSHYCRRLTNRTPLDYLAHCRIERACDRLRQPAKAAITDVAFACGFQSSQYFASVFKQHKGISPGAWQRRQRAGD